jgi:hypothetical protein
VATVGQRGLMLLMDIRNESILAQMGKMSVYL